MNKNINDKLKVFDELMGKIVPDEFRTYLIENGFFTAPASTKYHGSYEGGLFDHCLSVATELKDLSKANRLKWQHPRSPLLIGMFHDLCKIDNYELIIDDPGKEMFGGEVTGREVHFEYRNDQLIPGHGDKSSERGLILWVIWVIILEIGTNTSKI